MFLVLMLYSFYLGIIVLILSTLFEMTRFIFLFACYFIIIVQREQSLPLRNIKLLTSTSASRKIASYCLVWFYPILRVPRTTVVVTLAYCVHDVIVHTSFAIFRSFVHVVFSYYCEQVRMLTNNCMDVLLCNFVSQYI